MTRLDWLDLRDPSRTLFLRAPLAQEAGGLPQCAPSPYRDADDPDYRAARALVEAAVNRAWREPRRDLADR